MTTIPSPGIDGTSSRRISIRGCASIAAVILAENTSRSTVSACPPGTRADSAARINSESNPAAFLL